MRSKDLNDIDYDEDCSDTWCEDICPCLVDTETMWETHTGEHCKKHGYTIKTAR